MMAAQSAYQTCLEHGYDSVRASILTQMYENERNKPNEAKVKGVPLGKTVKVRWIVSNKVCIDADNYAELALTNNNCTTFEPSVEEIGRASCRERV